MRVDAATICGTDLHILEGDVPEVEPGTILGHEAVLEGVKHQENLPAGEAPVTAGASRGGA
jgi:threonine dehydrogenase-like Zn-dependent dehydrogenase